MPKKNKIAENLLIKWVAVFAYAGTITVNLLANLLPFNGNTTAQVSDSYPNLFAPANYTFSIWGLIYVSLFAFAFYQFNYIRPRRSLIGDDAMNRLSRYFAVSSALNAVWMFAWHYRVIGLSVVIMAALLFVLVRSVNLLHGLKLTKADRWFAAVPFSLYAGWITVATIANVTAWLVSSGWNGWGVVDWAWTVIVLTVGAVIASVVGKRYCDPVYLAVPLWAYLGIYVKHLTAYEFRYPAVVIALIILSSGISYVLTTTITSMLKARKS